MTEASGRFLLRIDPGLHAALRSAAAAAGMSLNEFCTRRLAAPAGNAAGPVVETLERVARLQGEAVVAIVAFGSWARGEATAGSDLDLLIVLDDTVALRRDLYRPWDEHPLFWQGYRVEPHFVHLPESAENPSSLWLEVAVDGAVLFERGLDASRFLAGVRARMVDGGLVRRRSHGQPYWVVA